MSSWLSNNLTGGLSSLSNFTGQISSFTREMLTEGTEEVSGKKRFVCSGSVSNFVLFKCFSVVSCELVLFK